MVPTRRASDLHFYIPEVKLVLAHVQREVIVYKKLLHERIGFKGLFLILLTGHIQNDVISKAVGWIGFGLIVLTLISFYGEPFRRRP